jgi:hypothetical protein
MRVWPAAVARTAIPFALAVALVFAFALVFAGALAFAVAFVLAGDFAFVFPSACRVPLVLAQPGAAAAATALRATCSRPPVCLC